MVEEDGCQGKLKDGDKIPVLGDRAAQFDTLTTETMGVGDNTHQTQDCSDKLSQPMVCQEVDKSLHKTTSPLQRGG